MHRARTDHYVETLAGRRRPLGVTHSHSNPPPTTPITTTSSTTTPSPSVDKARPDRQAVNSVIQGSAADLLKCAMILLWKPLEALGCEILLQIHDELIIDCPKDDEVIKQVVNLLNQVMCVDAKNMLQALYRKNHPEVTHAFTIPLEQSVKIGTDMSFGD